MERMVRRAISLLLALVLSFVYIPVLNDSVLIADAETVDNKFVKTAHWTEKGDSAEIILESNRRKAEYNEPLNVLFLGSICTAHNLDATKLNKAINALSDVANVDYYLFGLQTIGLETKNKSPEQGHLDKGQKVSFTSNNLESGNHVSHFYYADVLNSLEKELNDNGSSINDKYDLVVLEFDGIRMGYMCYYDSSSKTYKPMNASKIASSLNSNYYKKTSLTYKNLLDNLKSAANILKPIYADNKVAWLVPETTGYDDGKSFGGEYIYEDNDLRITKDYQGFYNKSAEAKLLRAAAFDTLAIIAPEDWLVKNNNSYYTLEESADSEEKFKSINSDYLFVESNGSYFYKRAATQKYTNDNKSGIWTTYGSEANITALMTEKTKEITHFRHIKLYDTVTDGFKIANITTQYCQKDSEENTRDWKTFSDSDVVKINVTGQYVEADFDIPALNRKYPCPNNFYTERVRLLIEVTASDNVSYFTGTDGKQYVYTNNGNAIAKYDEYTDDLTASSPIISKPEIIVEKLATYSNYPIMPRDTVTYIFNVTNPNSDFTIKNVKIYDELLGYPESGDPIAEISSIAPGNTETIRKTYTVKNSDKLVSGSDYILKNVAVFKGTYGTNNAPITGTATNILEYDDHYKIFTSATNGEITPDITNIDYGDTKTVFYTPSDGYHLESVIVDEDTKDINIYKTSYTFSSITDFHEITVVFTPTDYKITYRFDGDIPAGVVLPTETDNNHYNETKDVEPSPRDIPGYEFLGWKSEQVTPTDGKFTMPAEDVLFTGTFKKIPYHVTYEYTGTNIPVNAPNPPKDNATYYLNDNVSVANKPAADGWYFNGWVEETGTDIESLVIISDGQFIMPARDVKLVGSWTRRPVYKYEVNNPKLGAVNNTREEIDPNYPDPDGSNLYWKDEGVEFVEWIDKETGKHVSSETNLELTPENIPDGKWDKDYTFVAVLTQTNYNVIYVYDDTAPANADKSLLGTTTNVHYGTQVPIKKSPADTEEYRFLGWKISDTDLKDYGMIFVMPAHDVTIVGSWEKIPEITYGPNDEDMGDVSRTSEKPDSDQTSAMGSFAEPKEGYEFVKWVKSGTDETVSEDRNYVPTREGKSWTDASYQAVFTPTEYKITYVFINVPEDAPSDFPKEPKDTKIYHVNDDAKKATDTDTFYPGYVFSGWKSVSPDVKLNPDGTFSMPAEDVVFFGIWDDKESITIAYVTEDSTMGMLTTASDSLPHGVGTPTGSTASPTDKDKYHFVRWLDSAGKIEVSTDSNFVPSMPSDGWHDAIYIAEFAKNTYNIVYEIVGEEEDKPADWEKMLPESETDVEWGTFKFVKDDPEEVPGYTFHTWKTTDTNVEKHGEVRTFDMPAKDVLFQGYFTQHTATIIYKVSDDELGSVSKDEEKVKVVTGIATGSDVLTNTGVTFLGWVDEEGNVVSTNTTYVPSRNEDGLWENATYTALLTWTDYKVIYEFVGTETDWPTNWKELLPSPTDGHHYEDIYFLENTPEAEGWIFDNDKWFNYNKDTKVMYKNGDYLEMPDHDVTLYGSWTRKPVLTYTSTDAKMGTVTEEIEKIHPDAPKSYGSVAKPNPGYEFVEWIDKDGKTVSTDSDFHPEKPKSGWTDTDYRAVFKPIDYKITYKYVGDLIPDGAMAQLPTATDHHHVDEEKKVEKKATIKGYVFSGWTTTDAIVSGSDFTMPAKDVEFVGSWTEIPHVVIKYKSQDISEGKVSHTKDDFNPVIDSPDGSRAVAKDGYHFVKWVDEYGRTVSTSKFLDPADIKEQKNGWKEATYIAVFAPDEYKISYAYEGSLIPEGANKLLPSTTIHNVAGSKKVVEDVPVIKGYIFKGWKTGDVTVKDGKFTMPDKNVKFVGVWEKEEENPNTGALVFGDIVLP